MPTARSLRPAALLLSLASVAPGNLFAATGCTTASCATSCTPGAPVQISTLIGSSAWPAGFDTPTAFVDPGDQRGRRLIATQEGQVLIWNGITGALTTFLDISGPVQSGGEQGLLSLAVDPEYATTGQFYVFYTRADSDIVIERYTRSADPDVADPASALKILVINHAGAGNHNGGTLAFGPDGFLYISTGDGGPQCDNGSGNNGDGQSASTIAGKILRIDVRNVDPAAGAPDDCGQPGEPTNYEVPSTNPFFNLEPACDEVWAMGLRNPFRFTFDRLTGDMYVGDVGQLKWEEINLLRANVAAPVNFGWVCREGCETANNDESGCSVAGCPTADSATSCQYPRTTNGTYNFWDPILCHHNPGWQSIMAGYRYRGERVPSISGDFVYGDNVCGQIWKTTTLDTSDPAAIASSCWASGFNGTYGFGQDALGELYVVVGGASRISCIHNGAGCTWANWGLFEDGFETQDTGEWSAAVP